MGINPVSSISSSLLTLSIGGASAVNPTATASAPSQAATQTGGADSSNLDLSQLADAQIQIVLQNRQADLQRSELLTLLQGISVRGYQSGQAGPPAATVNVSA
jgi:hypothetical protein